MSTLLPENFETVSPTDSDARLALESSRILASRKLGKKRASESDWVMTIQLRGWLSPHRRCDYSFIYWSRCHKVMQ